MPTTPQHISRITTAVALFFFGSGCSANYTHGVTLGTNTEKVVTPPRFIASGHFPHTVQVRAPAALLRLDVAADIPSLQRGLAGRTHLAAHTGMLFVSPYPGDKLEEIWMRDTRIPVDVVFLKKDGTTTAVAQNVPAPPPHALDYQIARRFGSGHFVIELPAGEAARDHITKGTKLASNMQSH